MLERITQLDNQITGDALKLSLNYPDLLSLVARQAMSALEITVSKNADGSFNSSDIMAFMKDDGQSALQGMIYNVFLPMNLKFDLSPLSATQYERYVRDFPDAFISQSCHRRVLVETAARGSGYSRIYTAIRCAKSR